MSSETSAILLEIGRVKELLGTEREKLRIEQERNSTLKAQNERLVKA